MDRLKEKGGGFLMQSGGLVRETVKLLNVVAITTSNATILEIESWL